MTLTPNKSQIKLNPMITIKANTNETLKRSAPSSILVPLHQRTCDPQRQWLVASLAQQMPSEPIHTYM